jgi:hypothetical protein
MDADEARPSFVSLCSSKSWGRTKRMVRTAADIRHLFELEGRLQMDAWHVVRLRALAVA